MGLSDVEVKEIKDKLLLQINNLPVEKREDVKEQIKKMSSSDLEEFLKKNEEAQKCFFCSILEKEVESVWIYEDKMSVYVLDIKPLSYGHTLVIPKDHGVQDIEDYKEGIEFVSEIFKKIFVPKEIKILSKTLFGHTIFEIVPDYGEELQKRKVELDDLKKIKEKFNLFLLKEKEKLGDFLEDEINEEIEEKSDEEVKGHEKNDEEIKEVKEKIPSFSARIP